MKKIFTRTLYITACVSLAISCKPKLDDPSSIDKGSLNLTTYVSIGNSITAGYADNALYRKGQENSYAKLLAEQFQLAGGGAFKIPYVNPNSVGIGSTGGARLELGYATDCKGTSLSPKPIAASGDPGILDPIYSTEGPFNNIGVPGAKSFHVPFAGYGRQANGVGNYNPFFRRMAANENTSSMLSDALARNPTFFSLFIGNNDVLLYALSGGAADAITSTPVFNASIDTILKYMTLVSPQGVVANIPDITSLPYFTTIPYNGLVIDAATASQLNVANSGTDATFHAGANGFLIADIDATGGKRNAKPGEFILLSTPQVDLKCNNLGSVNAIANQYVLTETEVSAITTATTAYNSKLKAAAEAKGLAFVDANAFLKSAIKGLTFDGINVSTTFVSGGAFSLDGVHLTPLGNALLANQFILSINAKYGSTLPLVDVTKYHGVVFPN